MIISDLRRLTGASIHIFPREQVAKYGMPSDEVVQVPLYILIVLNTGCILKCNFVPILSVSLFVGNWQLTVCSRCFVPDHSIYLQENYESRQLVIVIISFHSKFFTAK